MSGASTALAAAHGRLRVRRGPRQRVPTGRADRPVDDGRADAQYLQDFGNTVATGHDDAPHHAVPGGERRSCLRRRHHPVGWGLDGRPRRRQSPGRLPDAAGDVNMFADMGVLPTTLMSGLAPASASHRHAAPPSPSPPGRRHLARERHQRHGHGHRRRHRRRSRRGRRGVPRRRRHLAPGQRHAHPWSYTGLVTGDGPAVIRSRATDDSVNIETPSAVRVGHRELPVLLFGTCNPGHRRLRRPERLRTRDVRFSSTVDGTGDRRALLQELRPTPARTSARCGPRLAPCWRPARSPARPRSGWQTMPSPRRWPSRRASTTSSAIPIRAVTTPRTPIISTIRIRREVRSRPLSTVRVTRARTVSSALPAASRPGRSRAPITTSTSPSTTAR